MVIPPKQKIDNTGIIRRQIASFNVKWKGPYKVFRDLKIEIGENLSAELLRKSKGTWIGLKLSIFWIARKEKNTDQ